MDKIIRSRKFKIAAGVAGIILIAFVSFAAGMRVGFRKARFSYKWGENYERNFAPPRPFMGGPRGILREMEGRDFRNGHGIAGSVISITENNLVIRDRDDKENTVVVTDRTILKRSRDNIEISDLKAGEQVVVLGRPGENGMVEADLVRVFN